MLQCRNCFATSWSRRATIAKYSRVKSSRSLQPGLQIFRACIDHQPLLAVVECLSSDETKTIYQRHAIDWNNIFVNHNIINSAFLFFSLTPHPLLQLPLVPLLPYQKQRSPESPENTRNLRFIDWKWINERTATIEASVVGWYLTRNNTLLEFFSFVSQKKGWQGMGEDAYWSLVKW